MLEVTLESAAMEVLDKLEFPAYRKFASEDSTEWYRIDNKKKVVNVRISSNPMISCVGVATDLSFVYMGNIIISSKPCTKGEFDAMFSRIIFEMESNR